MIKIKINKKEYRVKEGERVIDVCREHDIEIASLCDHEDFKGLDKEGHKDKAVCRLCLVKTKTKEQKTFCLTPSCLLRAQAGMEIVTQDAELNRLRKTNLELLFADHAGLCASCARNLDCELQDLAQKYDIDEFRFVPRLSEMNDKEELGLLYDKMADREMDHENPCIARDSLKCIKCRRCVRVCRDFQTVESYSTYAKGVKTKVGTEFNTPLECTYCGQCTTVCPTAALVEKNEASRFLAAVNDPEKIVVVQTAPSVRVALGEEFGAMPGTLVTGKMVQALRDSGADLVFDTNFAADLTIMEEAAELIRRIRTKKKPLPMFTSCCPAWVLFMERYYPNYLDHLSTARSPQMMMGSLIKSYWAKNNRLDQEKIFSVSVMPCVAKKYEIARPEFTKEGLRDMDCVLTTREFGRMLRNKGVNLMDLEDSQFDPALGCSTGAAFIFGASGGVMEAALRTAGYLLTGKEQKQLEFKEVRGAEGIRTAEVELGGVKLKVKVAHGLGNARKVMEDLKQGKCDFDFLEVMACPNGCVGGGGQPVPTSAKIRKARAAAIYNQEGREELRRSHENPLVKEVYDKFLVEPGSRKAEKLLHTKYYPYQFKWR